MNRAASLQTIEPSRKLPCNNLGQNVSRRFDARSAGLYAADGQRKYLNRIERSRALAAMETLDAERCLFALLLAWTGARVSEVLALTPEAFQTEVCVVTITTLKQRRHAVREVPIPPSLMRRLDGQFSLRRLQRCGSTRRMWPWHRVTAWRVVKHVMALARVTGRRACPRGLRHAFGVGTLQSAVPLTLIQRWMGHTKLSTTAIYANVCGPEEIAFARQFWNDTSKHVKRFASASAKMTRAA